jgi:hypothetical protein
MRYVFEKGATTIAVLTMPDNVECFSIIGELMEKLGVKYVTLEKDEG